MTIKNENHAVFLSLSLWHWCSITGKNKIQYPRFFKDKYNEFNCACAQCEYIWTRGKSCSDCFMCNICTKQLPSWQTAVQQNNVEDAKYYAQQIFETVQKYQKMIYRGD